MDSSHTIVITGAKGNLGGKLRAHWKDHHQLVLLDRDADADPEIVKADVGIWSNLWVDTFAGADTVVHLAADGIGCNDLTKLRRTNVDGTANVFKAAAKAGVRRIIFASTSHVMGKYMYSNEPVITASLQPQAGGKFTQNGWKYDSTEYATTKLYGEELGKRCADDNGIEVIVVRIGFIMTGANDSENFPQQTDLWLKQLWMSNRDFCRLMDRCLLQKLQQKYSIVHGISNNAGSCWDLQSTQQLLGFEAQDGLTVDIAKIRQRPGYVSRLQAAISKRISISVG